MKSTRKLFVTFIALSLSGIIGAQDLPSWVSGNTQMEIQRVQQQQRMRQQPRTNVQPMTVSPTTQALIDSYNWGRNIPPVKNSDYNINNSRVGNQTFNFHGATDTRGMTGNSSSNTIATPNNQRQRVATLCSNCGGRGICPVCNGRKIYQVGTSNRYFKCHCGNGKCGACGGSGKGGYVYR